MNKSLTGDYIIAYLTLLSGLSISTVAVYYSVIGLISIFSAAATPIMIMGVVLELSKLVATVWLKRHWKDASFLILSYLTAAVLILMLITSMGIFGYLSKAHLDQAIPSGDIIDKVTLLDEKINVQKENIEASRKALSQMELAFDQTMARSTSEQGASRAVQIRRTQTKERTLLQGEISASQKEITKLKEERTPIARELRKVEAEVGPIKYIAALIYGDKLDDNLLERAVRWMIILIVAVFDPLAIILLLGCQHTFREIKDVKNEKYIELIDDSTDEEYIYSIADIIEPIADIIPNEENIIVDIEQEMVNNITEVSNFQNDNMEGLFFPNTPEKGQRFTRLDYDPPRTFSFDGVQWINAETQQT